MMRQVVILLVLSVFALQCKKLPERRIIELELNTVNDVEVENTANIEVDYNSFTDLTFSYSSDSPLDLAVIEYGGGPDGGTFTPTNDELISQPEEGDTEGEFTVRVTPIHHFQQPTGNSVLDRKTINIELLNENGVVKVLKLNFLIL